MLLAGVALAQEKPGAPSLDVEEPPLDVVLVRGEHPGPALWKVSSGDHRLWIMGEVETLPGRMKWRSKQFEKVLKESQEVLVDESDRVPEPKDHREFKVLLNAAKLPGGKTLRELISPVMYARAEAVQKKFKTRWMLDGEKPWAASARIYHGARRALELMDFSARERATGLALKAKVRITTLEFRPTFAEHLGFLGSAQGDDCVSRVVEVLEDGGNGMRRLANAWSIGDIQQLRDLVPAYELTNEFWGVNEFIYCYRGGQERAREFFEQRTAAWMRESERVLRDNRSTIAVMPIGWLLAPDGFAAQLRSRGYEVVEPE
jgi:uncharacterized protein YbaP (TraB family)